MYNEVDTRKEVAMNGPKWRTYGGYKRAREEAKTGAAWSVICTDDNAIVRVPMLRGKLRDLSFSFRQDDDFLTILQRFKRDPNYKVSKTRNLDPLSEIIVNRLVVESQPTQYRRWRARADQAKDVEFTEEHLRKLGVSVRNFLAAQEVAARAIAEHFLKR